MRYKKISFRRFCRDNNEPPKLSGLGDRGCGRSFHCEVHTKLGVLFCQNIWYNGEMAGEAFNEHNNPQEGFEGQPEQQPQPSDSPEELQRAYNKRETQNALRNLAGEMAESSSNKSETAEVQEEMTDIERDPQTIKQRFDQA